MTIRSMSKWQHLDDYDASLKLCEKDLAKALTRGEIVFLLGSGCSSAMGLPSWPALLRNGFAITGLDSSEVVENDDFTKLKKHASKLKKKCSTDRNFLDTVHEALYINAKNRSSATPAPLLIAIGAMMMGSKRGRVKEVWTFNYDDILEWHLRLHGFLTQEVISLSTVVGDVDALIYHPHGYLPLQNHKSKGSDFLVFTKESYASRALSESEDWRRALLATFRTKVFIAVGLSPTDALLGDLLIYAWKDTIKQSRPAGFWCCSPNVSDTEKEDLRECGVVPVSFTDNDLMPPFLLRICAKAMESLGMRSS